MSKILAVLSLIVAAGCGVTAVVTWMGIVTPDPFTLGMAFALLSASLANYGIDKLLGE